ncbi:MAG: hypothetical protein QNJ54_02490 [Prochloraceae cyanobacterium]|nr:hypothetical protein [Prochloraceae cyanobacterium]
MQQKHKVTLYLPPGLHRQLKIKAAVEDKSMSAMVEKALDFYLQNPEKIEQEQNRNKTYQIHKCPECEAAMVMEEGQMVSLKNRKKAVSEDFAREVAEKVETKANSQGEENLVPC